MANDFNTEKPKPRTRKKGPAADNTGLEQKRGKAALEKALEKSGADKAAILEKLGGWSTSLIISWPQSSCTRNWL